MKKRLWYNKLKLEIDDDGMNTNKYLYRNSNNVLIFKDVNNNKTEDKQFIKEGYKNIKSTTIKTYVRGFIMQSKSFSDEEKKEFN